ncbi:MAG: nucleoid occlusion factor SlmA [Thiotrichales bacterium]|nr:nucleoid occlusion factor SlmA [Thiotrichales bacterium]
MNGSTRSNRRQDILEALARELETNPGTRITTASLARAVGVSEAALYRHFASKAKMFEGLIDFAEDSVFGLVNKVLEQESDVMQRCEKIIAVLVTFAERNPGISRVLIGDALVGENERLRKRVGQFFDRLETQLKQVLREANLSGETRAAETIDATANMLLTLAQGKMCEYIRSSFSHRPTDHLKEQWAIMKPGMFRV